MTPEEINKAIAEACGYVYEVRKSYRDTPGWYKGNVLHYDGPPNYWEDLNACAEMEATLNELFSFRYTNHLSQVLLRYCCETQPKDRPSLLAGNPIHATAPQRCEAFLRTKGLWR